MAASGGDTDPPAQLGSWGPLALSPLPSLHRPGWAAAPVAALAHAAAAAFAHSELIGRTAERGLLTLVGSGGGAATSVGEPQQQSQQGGGAGPQLASVRAAKAACESVLRLLENAPALPTAATLPYVLPLLPFLLLAQLHTDLIVAGEGRGGEGLWTELRTYRPSPHWQA